MGLFRKKPVVIQAITFDELVQHGIACCKEEGREHNIINGMPWSFKYNGHPITHENDQCYLIPTLEGTHNMTPADMLITGVKGEIYPCKRDIFEQTYESVDQEPQACEAEATDSLSFGEAIAALKVGAKVARAGWNGKGMWLVLVPGTPDAQLREGTPYRNALGMDSCEILPHIDMWTVNASGRRAMLPGWLASQSDMLAQDWMIVD